MSDQTLNESLLTQPALIPPSPFLDDTNIQFAIDSTSIGMMKTCPRLYKYTMIDGWQSRSESIHLRFGLEYHQALQEYDVSRCNNVRHEDAIHDVIRSLLERTSDWVVDRESKPGKYKNRDSLLGLVVDYLDHFIDDTCTTYIKSDGTPAVELSFRFELDWGPQTQLHSTDFNPTAGIPKTSYGPKDAPSFDNATWFSTTQPLTTQPYLLCGHLDRIVVWNDQLMVLDHKTTTTTPSEYYFNQYEPNNQMTLYTIAGQVVLNAPIKGVIISAAQILLEKPNAFIRGMTFRTPDQLDEWLIDLRAVLAQFESYAINNYWPMNDTACDKFGGCKFRSICSKSPQVREMFLKSDFEKLDVTKRWNPLNAR